MNRKYGWETILLISLIVSFAVVMIVKNWAVQQVSSADTAIAVPVAMYHSVTDEGESPGEYVISPSMLEHDLQYLSQRGYQTVTIKDLVDYVQNGTPLPEKPVMLTFDDGYYNNYLYAYPLLCKYHMRAVLSPVASLTEEFTQSQETYHEAWSYCTEEQLQEMAHSGVIEIQNHSYDFHELSPRRGCLRRSGESDNVYRDIFFRDTQRAQELFVSLGIEEPICYTYPYGACNEETEQLLTEYGFTATLSCEEGVASIVRDPACLRRIRRYNRHGTLTAEEFWKTLLERVEEGA